ncbi:MAG: hypothetical protein C0473_04165 [Cyanobacteria bacterium DS3.002]|nr:hypothetical protein [Cyanobacteria bacterium DS3.002]
MELSDQPRAREKVQSPSSPMIQATQSPLPDPASRLRPHPTANTNRPRRSRPLEHYRQTDSRRQRRPKPCRQHPQDPNQTPRPKCHNHPARLGRINRSLPAQDESIDIRNTARPGQNSGGINRPAQAKI